MSQQNITRRTFVGAGAVAALGLSLAACGGTGSDSANENATSTTSGTTDEHGYILVKEGSLIGASDLAYPPLESVPEGQTEPEGFEIDMMAALAERLGLTMEWLPATKFDTIIPMIKQGGRADVGVSAFTITDERKEEIDFTDSYLDSNQGLVTKAGATDTTEEALDADGKKVACQSGTTGQAWIEENLPNAECVPLDDAIQAMSGVSTGLYDACVADLPVVSYLCTQSYTDCQVAQEIATGEQYGIVVSKENTQLRDDLNQALADIRSDGTYDSLQEKWFGTTL